MLIERENELQARRVLRALVDIGVREVDAVLQKYDPAVWSLILASLETEHDVRRLAAHVVKFDLERQSHDPFGVTGPASDELRPDSA